MSALWFLPLLALAMLAIEYRARWLETRDALERASQFIKRIGVNHHETMAHLE